jgi:hypothetical protein
MGGEFEGFEGFLVSGFWFLLRDESEVFEV